MATRVDILAWERNEEDKKSHKHHIDTLNAMDDVEVDESVFIADDAHVYPDKLKMGADCYIAAGAILRGDLEFGYECTVNNYTQISGKVRIGNYVRIAANGTIVGFNHGHEDLSKPFCKQPSSCEGIIIEDDVWIGANVVICDGVTVGAHSLLAAGSIVVKDVAPYSIVGGNPAKLIRNRKDEKKTKKSS
ncbi:MAG: acyltransferase, partial [Planctomycetes bacterium]|nr:acyltransferase [Planctomycetota bacterium]